MPSSISQATISSTTSERPPLISATAVMPLGIERINVRTAQPNPNINFIKPLEGSHKAHAQDFLERVAAVAVPIMKANHVYVMSLEEFPPNNEFLGRNFNAGEVIQLVLKNKNGGWLPFKFVERVLMHELAHCKQMNHSKAFWQVNNQYCAELKTLWDKGYTGEGMWSRGMLLANGNFVQNRPLIEGDVPEHLCGGTFRSNRKRKRGAAEKEKVSYQERQQRRIAKKFGTNGVALGADDEVKAKLEKGKRPVGKPRVAGSARGRELRAAAALARLEKPQNPTVNGNSEGSDTESDEEDAKIKPDDAKDLNGRRLVDSSGRGMVKVCEDDGDNVDAHKEMEELRNLEYIYGPQSTPKTSAPTSSTTGATWYEQETSKNSYQSPYSASGIGYRSNSKTIRGTEKEHKTQNETPYGSSYQRETANRADPYQMKTKTMKQEVFDILSDYLGDPTCNPGGAIYSGLEAAKASMLARKPQSSSKSVDASTNSTSSSGVTGTSRHRIGSIHTSQPPMADNAKLPIILTPRLNSARDPSAVGVNIPLIRPLSHNNDETNVPPLRSHSNNNHSPSNSSHPIKTFRMPATYDEFWSSSADGNSLPNSIGAASRFARAVEKHHQAETIGHPPSPGITTKLPNPMSNAHRLPNFPASQLPNPLKQPPLSSRPASSRPPLENVTNFPSSLSAHSVPQHQQESSSKARPTVSKSFTQPLHPLAHPAPVSRAPVSAPRTPVVAPRPVPEPPVQSISGTCKMCTTINDAESLTCMICSNVLHPDRDHFHWKCRSAACKGTEYVNSGDYGVCGVCGAKKQL